MCGRFSQTAGPDGVKQRFDLSDVSDVRVRYNIAPTQDVPVVIESRGAHHLQSMRWGLVPRWSKDPSVGSKMINARGESVHEKPSFRDAFRSRRCLVIADGFYEWKRTGARESSPYRVVRKDRGLRSSSTR